MDVYNDLFVLLYNYILSVDAKRSEKTKTYQKDEKEHCSNF